MCARSAVVRVGQRADVGRPPRRSSIGALKLGVGVGWSQSPGHPGRNWVHLASRALEVVSGRRVGRCGALSVRVCGSVCVCPRMCVGSVKRARAVAETHVVTHGRIVILARGVKDVEEASLVVDVDLLPVKVLNRWVVCLCEAALDELDRERRLADATTADDDHLVIRHSLRGDEMRQMVRLPSQREVTGLLAVNPALLSFE